MDEFYFPMMALIDYRGYRLIGMTLLPISKRTQVFGSPNAGKTIYDDKEVHKLLDILVKRLNLRDHPVGKEASVRMGTPIDLEVHEGAVSIHTLLSVLKMIYTLLGWKILYARLFTITTSSKTS